MGASTRMALDHDHDDDQQPTAMREQIQDIVERPFTLPRQVTGLVNPTDIESFELHYNGNGAKIILRSWSKQKLTLTLYQGAILDKDSNGDQAMPNINVNIGGRPGRKPKSKAKNDDQNLLEWH